MRKPILVAAALLSAVWSLPAGSATARGPICESGARVGSTTYYSCRSGSHTALDMSNGTCNTWNHRAMIYGSRRYTYTGGCGQDCNSTRNNCNGGAGNMYKVTGASGWDFRQLHVNHTGSSYTKTCDRCVLGLLGSTGNSTGAHVHADNRRYGTRKSAWYTSVGTTCGRSAYCGNRVGVPTL